jgi:hypothetical protein
MAKKKSSDRHVTQHPKGGWQDKQEGAQRGRRSATQREAEQKAKETVRRQGGGEVTIHGRDGKIRDSDTIGKKDPFPPRDKKP